MEEENTLQQLRSKANEFLLRKDYNSSIKSYTQFITLCHEKISKTQDETNLKNLHKSLCLSYSNRAESWFKLKHFETALSDCEEALKIDNTHIKTLICKGEILMSLGRYDFALDCFNEGLKVDNLGSFLGVLKGFIGRCKRLDCVSKSGNFDVSEWIFGGFNGDCLEVCEFVGNVEIKRSEISGRGLFCTRNVDVGTAILVSKGVAIERCVVDECSGGLSESTQLVMWKNFVEKVRESVLKCCKTRNLIKKLSNGEKEDDLEVPNVDDFRPDSEGGAGLLDDVEVDFDKILSILDVNSFVEEGDNAKVLGKNSDYYGVGLWLLPCFINHSCSPNARRLHIGEYMVVVASREIKAGEEIMFSYFDVLLPLSKRKEMAKSWGFLCECKRCMFEEKMMQGKLEMGEIESGVEKGVGDVGCAIFRLEECMKRWVVRGKEKGYIRASFWKAFSEAYESKKVVRRWGRKIPALEHVVDSLVDAVGSDERIVKVLVRKLKKSGCGFGEMERAIKLGKGVYGKIMKKQALRILLELGVHD